MFCAVLDFSGVAGASGMRIMRKKRKDWYRSFGFCVACAIVMPSSIGHQDLGSLIARQSGVSERGHKHLRSSPALMKLHAATFSFPQPLGTAIPTAPGYQLASLDPRAFGEGGSMAAFGDPFDRAELSHSKALQTESPDIDNALIVTIHDSLVELQGTNAEMEKALQAMAARLSGESVPDHSPRQAIAMPDVKKEKIVADLEAGEENLAVLTASYDPVAPAQMLYFHNRALGGEQDRLEAYGPGEAPTLLRGSLKHPELDFSSEAPDLAESNEIDRSKTPAEWLGLSGAARAKQELCLSNAIYFEARSEPERGQMAVAQVVMNRVFSPYYPETICGVVYQNSHRRYSCQFTFACDRIRDVVTEPEAWEVATRIARDTLDGKIWLPEIGRATHYHATYVRPWWARSMNKYKTLGLHIFYRPKRWGDGSDELQWMSAVEPASAGDEAEKNVRLDIVEVAASL